MQREALQRNSRAKGLRDTVPVMSELSEEPSVAAGAQARRGGEGGEVREVRRRFVTARAVAGLGAQHLQREMGRFYTREGHDRTYIFHITPLAAM